MIFFPKIVLDLAIIIHGYQGLLAFAVLFLWHLYNVHLHPSVFPMNPSWITGKVSAEWLREEHPLEYEKLKGKGFYEEVRAHGGPCLPRWAFLPGLARDASASISLEKCTLCHGKPEFRKLLVDGRVRDLFVTGTRWRARCTGRRCARTAIST